VITPHPGELARLLDVTPAEVQADRLSYGARLSGEQLTCVLKGARTVTSGRGRQVLNTSGGPALAAAGTGDVLAGMVGALLAQGLEPLEAGALGAYLHGRAGDHAAAELPARSVIAEDVPAYLARAVRELEGR
jgi:NAD(P)H-hydrate epimerase